MRQLLSVGLVLAWPLLLFAADDKAKAPVLPIKIVALNRKTPILYEKDIEPIFISKCQTCHSGAVKEAQLDLSSYELLLQGGKKGRPIEPGKSSESLLVKLAGKTNKPFMPPKSEEPLTPEELALLKSWIDQGAKGPTNVRPRPKTMLAGLPASVHPIHALAVSPDKATIAAGRGDKIQVYTPPAGLFMRMLIDRGLTSADGRPLKASHPSIVESLAFRPDGKLLASGSFQEVALWDMKTGTLRQKLTGFADRVVALTFSHDGKLLAAGGGLPSQEGEIKIIDVASGKIITEIKNGHSDTVFGLCFSPDSKKLATGGADKFVKVFEVPSGKFLKSFEGHTHHVLDVGWKADGKLLASAGADGVIKVWDFEKGEQVRTLSGHSKQVTRLLFIGNTAQIITCSGDQTVRWWNVDNGGLVRTFGGNKDFLYAVGVSSDGALVAAGGEEGVVRLYNGTTAKLIRQLAPPTVENTASARR
jgi:hypothetical protein